ncbi:unnamed protein product [Onchocerca ochengi]|uniref:5'-deoxynucleotidase HDDC2 n=1 Tax=Onchocerca ochengi TaxID=42157 RepID=A0A182EKE4_ONCOC|nr:unnamed protein product [Onchocerca ochengi]
MAETTDIFSLLKILDELKHLKRTGWMKFNIPEPETVACHMYRMAVLAMLLDDSYDRAKCIRMTLVHDLGEAIIGDITPYCGISVTEKHRLENEAMKKITEMVPSSAGEDWYSLWQEYEDNETKEAKIVKHLDKFDMIVQAFHYEQKYDIAIKMGKRKRSDDDSVFGETDSSDTVLNSDAVSANSCGTNKDEYDIWLIRKPTKVCFFTSFWKIKFIEWIG